MAVNIAPSATIARMMEQRQRAQDSASLFVEVGEILRTMIQMEKSDKLHNYYLNHVINFPAGMVGESPARSFYRARLVQMLQTDGWDARELDYATLVITWKPE